MFYRGQDNYILSIDASWDIGNNLRNIISNLPIKDNRCTKLGKNSL